MIYKTQPYAKQLEAFNRGKGKTEFAYFMEMGTGKTKVIIDELVYLYLNNQIEKAIIFAPKGCYLNWAGELEKHFPDEIKRIVFKWVPFSEQGDGDKKALKHFKNKEVGEGLYIFLVNIETLSSTNSLEFLASFIEEHSTLMCVDESTTIRNTTSLRCRNARKLGKLAKFRRILTGTPIANRPLDIFGQCQFLNPTLLGFPSFHAFKHHYADIQMVPLGPRRSYPKLLGYRRLDDLTSRLNMFSYRVLKKDCLDLPDKVYVTRQIEATPEQKRMYNQMSKLMVAEDIAGSFSTASIALTKIQRLQMILCGHLKMDDGSRQIIPSNRVTSLIELLEETEGKVIIWCLFRQDVLNITEEMEEGSFVEYHGGLGTKEREESLFKFKKDPGHRFFVGTQRTGGVGLTLTEANTVIYFSQGYDLEMRLQSEDRAHRIGQKKNVTYIDFIVQNSVDEKIVTNLKQKQSLADLILKGLGNVIGTAL